MIKKNQIYKRNENKKRKPMQKCLLIKQSALLLVDTDYNLFLYASLLLSRISAVWP